MDKLDTSELGPIKIEPPKKPHDRLSLLEYVNRLNIEAIAKGHAVKYWTVTVLYNTVIYKQMHACEAVIHEVYKGILK